MTTNDNDWYIDRHRVVQQMIISDNEWQGMILVKSNPEIQCGASKFKKLYAESMVKTAFKILTCCEFLT